MHGWQRRGRGRKAARRLGRRATGLVAAGVLGCGVVAVLPASAAPAAGAENLDEGWLDALNSYRAGAGLPPVAHEPAWDPALAQLAEYMVVNNHATHFPEPDKPAYTPEAAEAAASANLWLGPTASVPAARFIDQWMESPTHGMRMLRPTLRRAGFGAFRDASSDEWRAAAGLDVQRGDEPGSVDAEAYPFVWPGDGTSVALTSSRNPSEAGCAGKTPRGLPIRVFLDPADDPRLTASEVRRNGQPVDHCAADHATYDDGRGRSGSDALGQAGAVLLTPLEPFEDGDTVQVRVDTATGDHLEWSFDVRPAGADEGNEHGEGNGDDEPSGWDEDSPLEARVVGFEAGQHLIDVSWEPATAVPEEDVGSYRVVVDGDAREWTEDTSARVTLDGRAGATVEVTVELVGTNGAVASHPQTVTVALPPEPGGGGRRFTDVGADHPHGPGIAWAAAEGITVGYADGTYRPTSAVTRAQMAAFLVRALDLPDAGVPDFRDVPAGHTHAQAIATLADTGIVSGHADGTFRPAWPVTRAQMASFLDRALDLPPAEDADGFRDVPADSVHRDAIDRLAAAGIATGFPDDTYRPRASLTRAQMATLLRHRSDRGGT